MKWCSPIRSLCLFSHEGRQFVFSLFKPKKVNENRSLLIKISSPKLESAGINVT